MPSPWKDARGITVTTTPTIEGKPIQEYLGIVTGEVIVGANLFRDLFANIRDIVGGRSGSYERIPLRGKASYDKPMWCERSRCHWSLGSSNARSSTEHSLGECSTPLARMVSKHCPTPEKCGGRPGGRPCAAQCLRLFCKSGINNHCCYSICIACAITNRITKQ